MQIAADPTMCQLHACVHVRTEKSYLHLLYFGLLHSRQEKVRKLASI